MKLRLSNRIAKNFKNEEMLTRAYGRKLAKEIQKAYSALVFADNLAMVPNVPPTRRHRLSGNYKGCWGLDVDKSYRLIIRPTKETEDLTEIDEVVIEDVVDYH